MNPNQTTRRDLIVKGGATALALSAAGPLLAACGSSGSSSTGSATSGGGGGEGNDPIKLGVLFSLSGVLSIAETAMHNGALLAIDEINAAGGIGGRMIEPVVEDYASDFSLVVQKARKLVSQDKVAATVGCYSSASRKAVLPVYEEANSVLVYPTFYEGLECSTNVIYSSLVANQHLTDAAKWMVKNSGKKIYMVGSNYVGPQTYNAIVKELAEKEGAQIVADRYFPLEQTEFGSVLSAIGAAKPDVIWCTIVGAGIPAFYKQYRAAGFDPDTMPIFSGITTEQELAAMGGAVAEGHFFPSSYFQNMNTPDNKKFVAAYKKKFGSKQPTNMPVQATYNSVKLVAAAIEKGGEATPEAILSAFPGVGSRAPGEGMVTVEEDNHSTHHMYLGRANSEALYDVIEDFGEIKPEPFPKAVVPASKIPTCPRRET